MRKTGFDLASWVITGLTLGGLAAGTGLPGGSALAAAGDMLVVTGDGVNVRFGPSADARVKMRVYHDQQVMELQREGDWVRAEIAGSGGQDGWIHGSLLAAPGGDDVAAPRAAASQPEAAQSPVPPPAASRAAAARGDLGRARTGPRAAKPARLERTIPGAPRGAAPPATRRAGGDRAGGGSGAAGRAKRPTSRAFARASTTSTAARSRSPGSICSPRSSRSAAAWSRSLRPTPGRRSRPPASRATPTRCSIAGPRRAAQAGRSASRSSTRKARCCWSAPAPDRRARKRKRGRLWPGARPGRTEVRLAASPHGRGARRW